MDFLRQFLIMVAIVACEGEELNCSENGMREFYLLEGEAFVFRHRVMENLHDEAFQWHKNGTQPEQIFTWENQSVHYHNKCLFFLKVEAEHAGVYTARHLKKNGGCSNYYARIHVVKSESDPKLLYGEISNSNKNMRVSCPVPIASICNNFRGNFSWKKDFKLLEGCNQNDCWIGNFSQADEGVYTCVCTWMHNSEVYQSTGSRKVSQERQFVNFKPEILSPEGSEVPASEGSVMKLNCTIFCGKNVPKCDAEWKMNGSPIPADGYSNETQRRVDNNSIDTFSTAVLTINKVSAKDFEATFTCTGRGLHDSTSKNIKLIWRKKTLDLVMESLGLLVCCLCVAVLLRCFSIDIILLLRPCLSLAKRKKDTRIYDAYVIYQTKRLDKDTEDRLTQFITNVLPSVLEDQCRYRLFIHGRDDMPGEDHLEMVESCVQQSRRLMVILTPSSGSELPDQHPSRPQYSDMGGFDWQIVLHHTLAQSETGVILIQIGETGPGGFTHLPPGLQHLILKNPPIRWDPESGNAGARNSRFWKKVRYLMPAVPARQR